ncbi:hypothetical protein key_088 [Erwinia phage KEY]|uniref:Uncharacterized protein n=2 Tax=Keyvirus TaxID=3152642 RepID=A0AAE8BCP0_9CAUD|nr:hypothetical protein AAS21_gp091 [Pantoea phage vB_PagS_AAS21]QYC51579.1 hypothetical protein key_088 [Erwinia phage KEY]
MKKIKVTFKCCGSTHIFTKYREYAVCNCGKCGYDSGDGYISRTIGPAHLIERKEVN